MNNAHRVQKALAIRFDSDAGDGLTLRQYFQELLTTLWSEGEGFNGKRPFGNSGWQYRIRRVITLGLADRDPNDDDGDEELDEVDDDFVEACIAAAFEPAPVVLDDSLRTLLNAVEHEVQRARGLFPNPNLLALAFSEEAGELTKAVLEEPLEAVRKEAIQAAAMALRLVLDGDPSTDAHRERQGLKKLGYSG